MDLGEMLRRSIELPMQVRDELADKAATGLAALEEFRAELIRLTDGKTRTTVGEVMALLDSAISDYTAASDPDYWSRGASGVPRQPSQEALPKRPIKDSPQA